MDIRYISSMELIQSAKHKNIYFDIEGKRYRKCASCVSIKIENEDNYQIYKKDNCFSGSCKLCRSQKRKIYKKEKNIKIIQQYSIGELIIYDLKKKYAYVSDKGIFYRKCGKCKKIKIEKDNYYLMNRIRKNGSRHQGYNSYCIQCEKKRNKSLKRRNNNNKSANKRYHKLKQDPQFRLYCSIKVAIWETLRKVNKKKNERTFDKLGYSAIELRKHLEFQFDQNMTWLNYGKYWHLDHIIPQADLPYDSMDHTNFKKCWALENLRPLEAIRNMSEGSKRVRHKTNNQ